MYISDLNTLKSALIDLQQDIKVKAVMLFGTSQNRFQPDEIQSVIIHNNKPLIGGIFPEIIADGERNETGFLLVPLFEDLMVFLFEDKQHLDLKNQIKESGLSNHLGEAGSLFCFINALWPKKSSFMQDLYNELGPFVNYVGGGAGSLSFQSFPCLFANQTISEHGAVVGFIQSSVKIGVAHGWHPISEPIKVTKTKGNTLLSLNWKPAFEVYKYYVESHSNQKFSSESFFDIAKSYPLGLVKLDDEMVIRDPYEQNEGSIEIVDEVQEGEYIRIMHGNIPSLLEGAKLAIEKSEITSAQETHQFCIDCISRVLFMKDNFKDELYHLNKIQKTDGVLSIGEIANPQNTALELFNKTIVVARWKKTN